MPQEEKVTLQTFRQLMDLLAQQRSRMEALANERDVSIIRVNCIQLKEALIPAPTNSLAELHEVRAVVGVLCWVCRPEGPAMIKAGEGCCRSGLPL